MTSIFKFSAAIALLSMASWTAQAQGLIIPQIADGGGWQTTIVLTNTSANATTASISFYQDTGAGNTQGWNPPFLETSSTANVAVPGAGTVFLHTSGTAGSTTVGWAQLSSASGSVVAYAIFADRAANGQSQYGTAPATATSSRVLVPYDNTNGFVTALAIANPNSASESVTVGIQPSGGEASSQPAPFLLPALGHMAVSVPGQFAATNGQSGLIELSSASGSISAVALRFDPAGAFTAAPVYSGSGAAIVGGGGGGGGTTGGGPAVQFTVIEISPNLVSQAGITLESGTILGAGDGTYYSGALGGSVMGSLAFSLSVTFTNVSASGETFTMSGVGQGSVMYDKSFVPYAITSGSATLTLHPQGAPGIGTVTGTFTVTSPLTTVSGSIAGSYVAN